MKGGGYRFQFESTSEKFLKNPDVYCEVAHVLTHIPRLTWFRSFLTLPICNLADI